MNDDNLKARMKEVDDVDVEDEEEEIDDVEDEELESGDEEEEEVNLFRMYILKISEELFLLCQISRFEEENKS